MSLRIPHKKAHFFHRSSFIDLVLVPFCDAAYAEEVVPTTLSTLATSSFQTLHGSINLVGRHVCVG